MLFWENVEYIREYKNMTRKELSLKADFSLTSISTGIARQSMPAVDVAVRIAQALGVTVEYLVTGKDPQETSLSPESRKLISLFSALSKPEKDAFLSLLEVLSARQTSS
jgi:transcriptional regulator with XRE-family HTH domain